MSEVVSIYKTLKDVSTEVQQTNFPKDARNKFQGYDYTSTDMFYKIIAPIMAKHGLWLQMSAENFKSSDKQREKKGKIVPYVFGDIEFVCYYANEHGSMTDKFKHIQTGEVTTPQNCGALYAYAQRYLLRKEFMVGLGELDIDAEPASAEHYHQPQSTLSQQAGPAQAPRQDPRHQLINERQREDIMARLEEKGVQADFLPWIINQSGVTPQTLTARHLFVLEEFLKRVAQLSAEQVSEGIILSATNNVPIGNWMKSMSTNGHQ